MRVTTLLLRPILSVTGCAATEPEPSNSLLHGLSVVAPLTTSVGNIGTTRVGLATAASVGVGRTTY